MAKFAVTFTRTVIERERVVREIEAADLDEAQFLAGEMADEFDRDCPDDVETQDGIECDGWDAARVAPVA